MIKLRSIIKSLESEVYQNIESSFIKNKADNFLFLLQSYRSDILNDNEIIESLDIKINSFYVLKSRLYDRIQEFLSGNIYSGNDVLIKQLHQIPHICLNNSREISETYLKKLEQDLLKYDMHNELIVVYSALKKVHTYSDKYFFYSKLFNKHIAYFLSQEKSTEILANFNRVLGQYQCSMSEKLLETLEFLRRSISEHYALNKSRQIELIKNIIEIQLQIFTKVNITDSYSTEEGLEQCRKIVNELPETDTFKNWDTAIDFLAFEYYFRIEQYSNARIYFEKVDGNLGKLLLSAHICLCSMFLISKIAFLQILSNKTELQNNPEPTILIDPFDIYSNIMLGIYRAMSLYYMEKYKESALSLNQLLSLISFKDYFHINTDIKLSLVFMYLKMEEYDLADNLMKSISRKIKSEKLEKYKGVLDLLKVFSEEVKNQNRRSINDKQKDSFTLFKARNKGESELLRHLKYELAEIYS